MGGRKDRLFQIGLGLTICNLLFDLIAFVSPYWIESIPEFKSKFVRLGLWVACFDNFVYPQDYVSKGYTGCWYIYYPEYYYIRPWLNPPWFYLVQMLALVAFICRCVTMIMVLRMALNSSLRQYDQSPLRVTLGTLFIETCFSIVYLILVGVKSRDREWMPRPDQNRLSWGYGFAVLAGFCSVFGFMIFTLMYLRGYWKDQHMAASRGGAPAGHPLHPLPSMSEPPQHPYQREPGVYQQQSATSPAAYPSPGYGAKPVSMPRPEYRPTTMAYQPPPQQAYSAPRPSAHDTVV